MKLARIAPAGYKRALHSLLLMYISRLKDVQFRKLIPVMDLRGKFTGYHDPLDVQAKENVWDRWFEQPILTEESVFFTEYCSPGLDGHLYFGKQSLVEEYSRLAHHFLKIKPTILKTVQDFYSKNLTVKSCALHIRGTDSFFDKGRPHLPLSFYFKLISEKLYKFDKIYILTDMQTVPEILKKKFGSKIVFRSISRKEISNGINAIHEDVTLMGGGVSVLIDSIIASKCEYLFAQYSNINQFSKIWNPSLKLHYYDLDLVDSSHFMAYISKTSEFYDEDYKMDMVEYVENYKNYKEKLEVLKDSLNVYKNSNKNIKLINSYFFDI